MPTPEERKAELSAELEQTVKQYNQANQVLIACKQRISELQGGVAALDSLIEPEVDSSTEETA